MRLLPLLATSFIALTSVPAGAQVVEEFTLPRYEIGGAYDRSEFEEYPPIFDERLLNLVKPIEVVSMEGLVFQGLIVVGETQPGIIDWTGLAFYYPMPLSRRAETLLAIMELFEGEDEATVGELDAELMGNLVFQLPEDILGTIAVDGEGIIAMWGDRQVMKEYMGVDVPDLTVTNGGPPDTMTMYGLDVLDVIIERIETSELSIYGFADIDLYSALDESDPRYVSGGYDEELGYEVHTFAESMAFEGQTYDTNVHATIDDERIIDFLVISLEQPESSDLDPQAFQDQVETWLYDWVYANYDYSLVVEDTYLDPYPETSWSLDPAREKWLILSDVEGRELMVTRDETRVMLIYYLADDFEGETEETTAELAEQLEV